MSEKELKEYCRGVMEEQYKDNILKFQIEIETLKAFNQKLQEQMRALMSNNKSSIDTSKVLIKRVDAAVNCIKDFLCTMEYINLDGKAIAENYGLLLDILEKGAQYVKKD